MTTLKPIRFMVISKITIQVMEIARYVWMLAYFALVKISIEGL
jgi:hypothetical protein